MSWWWPTQLDRIETALKTLNTKVTKIMALVQVEQSDLDALDAALDDATASLAAKIDALIAAAATPLPPAELAALQADVDNLRALSAPPVVEPPAV